MYLYQLETGNRNFSFDNLQQKLFIPQSAAKTFNSTVGSKNFSFHNLQQKRVIKHLAAKTSYFNKLPQELLISQLATKTSQSTIHNKSFSFHSLQHFTINAKNGGQFRFPNCQTGECVT